MTFEPDYRFYSSPECLLVFPTLKIAYKVLSEENHSYYRGDGAAGAFAAYWSHVTGGHILHMSIGERFLILDSSADRMSGVRPLKILSETGVVGYVLPYDWLEIEVVK